MKSFGNTIKLLTLAFACIFFLNMLVMHMLFNTDVFNPVNRDQPKSNIAGFDFYSLDASELDVSAEEADPDETSAVTEDYQEEINEAAAPEDYVDGAANEAGGTDSTYFMTTGEVGFLENLGMLDKLEALSLISKVGREEADKIYDLAMDGITYTEMEDIEAILGKYLDKDEMGKLTALLEKNKKKYSIER